jgi:hypothetical protein
LLQVIEELKPSTESRVHLWVSDQGNKNGIGLDVHTISLNPLSSPMEEQSNCIIDGSILADQVAAVAVMAMEHYIIVKQICADM